MTHAFKNHIITYAIFGMALFVFSIFSESIITLGNSQVAVVSEFGAAVTETPTNKLALDLRNKSNELNLQEKSLQEREALLAKERESMESNTRNILLATLVLSLLTLLIMNGYVYKRDKSSSVEKSYNHTLIHIPRKSYSVDLHNINKNMA